jgi:hypothetical protein
MKKLLLPLLATAALAAPAAASAHFRHHHSLLAKLSGTGASFAGGSATASGTAAGTASLASGTFTATITSNLSLAKSNIGEHASLTCAPATATLKLTGATSTNTVTSTLTGKTCTWTATGGASAGIFVGRGPATGAGSLSGLTGQTEKAFLFRKADGTVRGAVFAGAAQRRVAAEFAMRERDAANVAGRWDH